jgi:hypothetical protein
MDLSMREVRCIEGMIEERLAHRAYIQQATHRTGHTALTRQMATAALRQSNVLQRIVDDSTVQLSREEKKLIIALLAEATLLHKRYMRQQLTDNAPNILCIRQSIALLERILEGQGVQHVPTAVRSYLRSKE